MFSIRHLCNKSVSFIILIIFCLFGIIRGNGGGRDAGNKIENYFSWPSESINGTASLQKAYGWAWNLTIQVERSFYKTNKAYNITITRWVLSSDTNPLSRTQYCRTTQLFLKQWYYDAIVSLNQFINPLDCDVLRILLTLNQTGLEEIYIHLPRNFSILFVILQTTFSIFHIQYLGLFNYFMAKQIISQDKRCERQSGKFSIVK